FDIAFEGICNLHNIEIAVRPLSDKEINDNIETRKRSLRSITLHAEELRQKLKNISVSDFSWRDALANQVIMTILS
ncbi:17691_t:CDS:2, partial [Funneliformis geosporum]